MYIDVWCDKSLQTQARRFPNEYIVFSQLWLLFILSAEHPTGYSVSNRMTYDAAELLICTDSFLPGMKLLKHPLHNAASFRRGAQDELNILGTTDFRSRSSSNTQFIRI